jgi:hypothetical protein
VSKKQKRCSAIPGLETEIPDGMILNARTIAILYALENKGVVYMQFDDSPNDDETGQQLQEIAGNVGYTFCWEKDSRHSAFLIDCQQVTEV